MQFSEDELKRQSTQLLKWQEELQSLLVEIDSSPSLAELCCSLNRIKLEIREEAMLARKVIRRKDFQGEILYWLTVDELAFLLRTRVDSKPCPKLRENISQVLALLSITIDTLSAMPSYGAWFARVSSI